MNKKVSVLPPGRHISFFSAGLRRQWVYVGPTMSSKIASSSPIQLDVAIESFLSPPPLPHGCDLFE